MKIFIDCEFNDFQGELISMALVDETGREFYESLGCENPSTWVAENVMPHLGRTSTTMAALQFHLQWFLRCYDQVHIIADWPEDIKHFCDALITGPGMRIDTPPLTMEVRRDLDAVSAIPHNALEDAKAIRLKYLELRAAYAGCVLGVA